MNSRCPLLVGAGTLLALFIVSIPSVAGQESEPGSSRCSAVNVPRHAGVTAAESRLARRAACLDLMTTAFEADAEALAAKYRESLPRLASLAESAAFLRASGLTLHAVATSREISEEALSESYLDVLDVIAVIEEKLNGLGDDAQLANVDLQNILQKQQQTLQMMSNISKMLYDTAQSIIRKIGG